MYPPRMRVLHSFLQPVLRSFIFRAFIRETNESDDSFRFNRTAIMVARIVSPMDPLLPPGFPFDLPRLPFMFITQTSCVFSRKCRLVTFPLLIPLYECFHDQSIAWIPKKLVFILRGNEFSMVGFQRICTQRIQSNKYHSTAGSLTKIGSLLSR